MQNMLIFFFEKIYQLYIHVAIQKTEAAQYFHFSNKIDVKKFFKRK